MPELTGSGIQIGILDIFGKNKGIPINGVTPDYTHGELTSGVLSSLTEDIDRTITRIPVAPRSQKEITSLNLSSLLSQLKEINVFQKDFDYLNISGSWPIPYDVFGLSDNGEELTEKEVQKEVLEDLKKITVNEQGENRIAPEEVIPIISELERIIQSGTEIYISACNKANSFNSFSLAEGIHTIGGLDGVTGKPISRFSHNPLVETFVKLPIYVSQNIREHVLDASKTFVNLKDSIDIGSDISKISKDKLEQATNKDLNIVETVVNDLDKRKKFKFDIDFLRFKFVNAVSAKYQELTGKNGFEQIRNKIFDIGDFLGIFKGKLDKEVLEYTHPQGTHCDLLFRQFFNMRSKNSHVIPMKETTEVSNTLSGTSFAAPQGLNKGIRDS